MTARFTSFLTVLLFLLMAGMAVGCRRGLDDVAKEADEPVMSLAMSVKDMEEGRSVATKMSSSITQSSGTSFRGIEEIYVIPFYKVSELSPVTANDTRQGNQNVSISGSSIAPVSLGQEEEKHLARLFERAFVPLATNRVLVYGEAKKSYTDASKVNKHKNGSLLADGLNSPQKAGDIRFQLEPILETRSNGEETVNEYSEASALADDILDKLNDVMEQLLLSEASAIKSIYDMISVYSEDKILACSYMVFNWISTQIFSALSDNSLYNASTIDDIIRVNGYASTFKDAIDGAGNDFPTRYGIPEGSMGFWWNGNKFVRLINGVNIALVDPEYYCYPPSLWYYTNSPVQTSEDEIGKNQFETSSTWNKILNDYYTDGPVVNSNSKSVAVKDNLQYGVGMLELSFLTPGTAAEVARGCPLTGIIIGDQKNAGFDFAPYAHTDENPNPSRYIYDNVFDNELTIGTTGKTVQTLVMQTLNTQTTVHFALEFKNTSGFLIPCEQGAILPNCKFYLAGELVLANATQPGTEVLSTIFTQDHKTAVNVKVESLKKAYNTVPDLHDPQLEIGIEAEMKWVPFTPQSITIQL